MKTIIYAGGELLTGDDIATAVLEYSAALAEFSGADTVDIPVLDAEGSRIVATVLIGPASQIMAVDAHTAGAELTDPEVVRRLQGVTRSLRPRAVAQEEPLDSTWSDEY